MRFKIEDWLLAAALAVVAVGVVGAGCQKLVACDDERREKRRQNRLADDERERAHELRKLRIKHDCEAPAAEVAK